MANNIYQNHGKGSRKPSTELPKDRVIKILSSTGIVRIVGGTSDPKTVQKAISAQFNLSPEVVLADPGVPCLRVKASEPGSHPRPSDVRLRFYS